MFALGLAVFLSAAMAGAWVVGDRSGRSGQVDAIWTFATGAACLGAVAYGIMFALVTFVTPEPREMTQTISPTKLNK